MDRPSTRQHNIVCVGRKENMRASVAHGANHKE
jgi:hypothetical protein